jgi:transcriptional regulator with XRE-family HTH domain
VDDLGFGRLIRMARIRRGWRQQDLAARAGASMTSVSRVERGRFGRMPIDDVRAIAAALEIRVDVMPRARAIDIDRSLNAKHAALAELATRWLAAGRAWLVRPEVSFSEFGERGVVDLLCWHAEARALLLVELKTELVDIGGLLATLDRKHRLAREIARPLDWSAVTISTCLLVADSRTNRRRVADHATLLRAALPDDGRVLARWLRRPTGSIRALRFVPDVRPGHVRSGLAGTTRVQRARPTELARQARSA